MSLQDTFKALSDPTRRQILELLREGRLTAGEIGSHFDMTGATVSHHLSILKDAGLVNDERQGKFIYYELDTSIVEDIMGWAAQFLGGDKHER
ncbi:MAG: autorepressor SdpR family transcription factor [Oscillospiraceae bacterium]|nr:autorepressor SdpR family transcription factor [Oscillospiraceae bacterium]